MPRTDPSLQVRALGPSDIKGFVRLMVAEHESLGGSYSPDVIRAVGRDAARAGGPAVVIVAEGAGEIRAAMVVLIGGSWYFWRRFPLRHPRAGLHLASKRVRKLIRKRFAKDDSAEPAGPAAPPREVVPLPSDLLDEPRLQVPAPTRDADGPHLRDARPDLAYGAMVLVKSELRNQGVGKRLHETAFEVLRDRGITRYDASFLFDYEPSIRMYLSLDFSIYRTSVGYLGSVDLVSGRWGRAKP